MDTSFQYYNHLKSKRLREASCLGVSTCRTLTITLDDVT